MRLYTDDLTLSVGSHREAFEVYREAKDILAKGNFNLRKWQSNDKALLSQINALEQGHSQESKVADVIEDDKSYAQAFVGSPVLDNQAKVLGLNWDCDKDDLFLDLSQVVSIAKTLAPNKRSLLKIAAKLYGPICNRKPLSGHYVCQKFFVKFFIMV